MENNINEILGIETSQSNTSKSYKLNGELIRSSGKNLRNVGYLMITIVIISIIYFLVIDILSYEGETETIKFVSILFGIVSFFLSGAIIFNIIKSGQGFIKSVQEI